MFGTSTRVQVPDEQLGAWGAGEPVFYFSHMVESSTATRCTGPTAP